MPHFEVSIMVYFSSTGNTQKVASAIKDGLEAGGLQVDLKKLAEAAETDFFGYDLVCVGSPSIEWQPAKPIADLLKAKLNLYRVKERLSRLLQRLRAKTRLFFCTYSGPAYRNRRSNACWENDEAIF